MPFAKNTDLPEAVRNALPEAAQTIFRGAFNSSFEKSGEAGATQIAWTAVVNAGYEKKDDGVWVKVSNNSAEFPAEIFSVGTWNGDKYTREDLDLMVAAFDTLSGEFKPPLKLGHNAKQPMRDGHISLGWVKALRREGDKLIALFAQVPDIIAKAIKAGLYKRVSSEIYINLKRNGQTFKRVLAGVALLGADIPAVSNLKDLEVFLSQSTGGPGSFDRVNTYSLEVDDEGGILDNNNKHGGDIMPGEEIQEYKDKNKSLETDLAAERVKTAKAADELKEFKDKKAADAKKSHAAKFVTFCEDQVKAGKMTPAGRDILTKDTDKLCYTESADDCYSVPLAVFTEFMDKQSKLLPEEKGDKGDGGDENYTDVGAEVDAKTKAYMREHKLEADKYQEAMEAVFDANPELAKAYIADDTVVADDDED